MKEIAELLQLIFEEHINLRSLQFQVVRESIESRTQMYIQVASVSFGRPLLFFGWLLVGHS